jgi:hypothetical protein
MNFNFSSGSLVIDTVIRGMNINCTNGEICDRNGNLLFYTNGIYVANAQDDTMLNGSGLNPGSFTTSKEDYGLTLPQGNLIIPFPDDTTKYYLFHETSDDPQQTWSTFYLYYSVIDMTLDNGLGGVVQKNTVLLNDTLVGGRLTACRHANGRDWWVVAPQWMTGNMIKFLITPSGIQGPFIQDLQTFRDIYFGQAVFSVQGDKFAYYEPYGDLDLFDFDRCTGDFSNRIHIDINDSAAGGGAAFSPSGRFLYVSSMYYTYQFDVWAADIAQSQTTVAVWDTFYSPWPPFATVFYLAQLAPDNKIYVNCPNSTQAMHVINYPDSAGLACDFCQNCIALPAYNSLTIPNHPNYFLGQQAGSLCDSLHIDVSEITSAGFPLTVFPNPARDLLYITQESKHPFQWVRVINSLGQAQDIALRSINKNDYIEVHIASLVPGIYFLEMISNEQKVVRRFVKE